MKLRSARASSHPAQFGSLSAVVHSGEPLSPLARVFESLGRQRHFAPGGTILLHGDPADTLFQVVSGTVRCCTITDEGHRCIFRFAGPGDFLGFPELETWHFTAEAVDHVQLLSAPRSGVVRALRDGAAPLQREINALIAREFAAREQQLVMLSHARADQRMLWFLTEFGRRADRDGFAHLPMTRQDIGDHLGMTIETVSRVLSALKRQALIEMQGSSKVRVLGDRYRRAA